MILNGAKECYCFYPFVINNKVYTILNKLFFFYIFVYFNFKDCKQYEYIFVLYIIYAYNT